jgi:hypothetical protein
MTLSSQVERRAIMGTRHFARIASLALIVVTLLIIGHSSPAPLAAESNANWRGEYYSNVYLSGDPLFVRSDPAIAFNWGGGSPASNIAADYFSVRWTADLYFEAGRHRFTTETDDGVRLFVDGVLLLDRWHEMPPTRLNVERELSAGTHSVRMEYFEMRGGATAQLWWSRITPTSTWRAEYYNNTVLSGIPVVLREETTLAHNWGGASPAPGVVNADRFSARWNRTISVTPGRYRFSATCDDGMRVWVDGTLLINEWYDHSAHTHKVELQLDGNPHYLTVEYYENGGDAVAGLAWTMVATPPTVGNLITCVPASPSYSWIKVYQLQPDGSWKHMNARGYGSIEPTGWLKIDGLPVDYARYGDAGHPYRVEQWIDGQLVRSVGATERGEAPFRIRGAQDNYTPWQCPLH